MDAPRRRISLRTTTSPRLARHRGTAAAGAGQDQALPAVAHRILSRLHAALHPRAICVFTPLCARVPLTAARLPPAIADLVTRYEPRAEAEGLYAHQAEVLHRTRAGDGPNVILTSATGTGKSLPFLAWVFDRLLADPRATALLCFPTQALMWSQAERLARVSIGAERGGSGSLVLGGSVAVGGQRLGWTVWKGTGSGSTVDEAMKLHEQSPAFTRARIRIATLDKAHYSLLGDRNREFALNLGAVVLDETHVYDGVFGANVRLFFARTAAALELADRPCPPVFLASATLGDPIGFATTLLSLEGAGQIVHVADSTRQEIAEVPLDEVPALLAAPPEGGLLRVVLLADTERAGARLQRLLGDVQTVGDEVNAITFVESKFRGRQLGLQLRRATGGARHIVSYDADLPPLERRRVERELNEPGARGNTVIATSALELGVDIDGLELCVVERTPPARQDLLQRIGRVGRRVGRPGLVVLGTSLAPRDQRLLEEPLAAFRLDTTKAQPIPVHLEMLTWRHLLAAYNEGAFSPPGGDVDPARLAEVVERRFGECLDRRELERRFRLVYGRTEDVSGAFWAHSGFRASLGQKKIPLRTPNGVDVAWIDDAAVYRDAHPEGVYLGHDGQRWRVDGYEASWRVARNRPGGTDVVLAKWLKCLSRVRVVPEPGNVVTRGDWEDRHAMHELAMTLGPGQEGPREGELRLGTWDFSRRWRGYRQHDLATGRVTRVTLADVTRRFREAIEQGEQFPFLHELTYRTFGWSWGFGAVDGVADGADVEPVVAGLLQEFIAAELECSPSDLSLRFALGEGELALFDAAPGGNGLTHALLTGGRMHGALAACAGTLARLARRPGREFSRYVAALLDIRPECDRREVLRVVEALRDRWHG